MFSLKERQGGLCNKLGLLLGCYGMAYYTAAQSARDRVATAAETVPA